MQDQLVCIDAFALTPPVIRAFAVVELDGGDRPSSDAIGIVQLPLRQFNWDGGKIVSLLEVKDRVQKMLTEFVGSVRIDSDGDFGFTYESAVVYVRAFEWEDSIVLRIFSQFLRDVPLTPELYRWVATDGQDFLFGNTALVEFENGIGRLDFGTYLLADYLDTEELRTAVSAVAVTADRLDDELMARFGGRRFLDD